jgi:putative SOS response-associated peptidase YedK
MAGIYDVRGGVPCFCILTTAANDSMREVHDRMPLVLERKQIEPWLYDMSVTGYFLSMTPPLLDKELLDAQIGLW